MRLLNERNEVKARIWFTYVSGYTFEHGEPEPFTDVLICRAGVDAAQNYLRHQRGDPNLVVREVEHERTTWACSMNEFLAIAEQTEGKYLDVKEL